jgi:hypothetical protein
MRRYYFDMRDNDGLAVDDEGMELRDVNGNLLRVIIIVAALASWAY